MTVARALGLVKRFDSTVALENVDLTVEAGQVRGLLGPNGAGKTTLLRILMGLIRANAGRVELFGRELRELGTTALHGVGGFVEDPCFYPYLSGRANLRLMARLDGNWATRSEIDDALTRVELGGHADHRLSGYSTGMRQRLGIAAALLRRPRLLLLDEPTSGLDPGGIQAVVGLVGELASDGVAVVLSSHQIGELEKVCSAYTVLRRGRVVWDGTVEDLRRQEPASAYRVCTSDDRRALEIAAAHTNLRGEPSAAEGFVLGGQADAIDEFVLALGDARVIIRRLELLASPLETLFFALTRDRPSDQADRGALVDSVLAEVAA